MPKLERYYTKDHSQEEALDRLELNDQLSLSVYLRRKTAIGVYEHLGGSDLPLNYDEFERRFGAEESEVDEVAKYLAQNGFTVQEIDLGRRRLVATGSVDSVVKAFGTRLRRYRSQSGEIFNAPENELSLPQELRPLIVDILGLDSSAQAKTNIKPATSGAVSYTPLQVAQAYSYPTNLTGKGVGVALIELGGGFREADISSYFASLGLAPPTVVAIGVDGGSNSPSTPNGPDGEVMLDIEVVGAIAPEAKIAVYFAPNTNQGFIDAVSQAAHDKSIAPSVISISWGGPENTWPQSSITLMAQVIEEATALGVTVTVAAGDNGSSDGETDGLAHVDFPASAPYALACGGTTLELNGSGQILSEVTWNDLASGGGATGGGISAVFPVPSYQSSIDLPLSTNPQAGPGRGVPDVAGNADPNTGYQVLVDGSSLVFGGTSAVAPLIGGLVARLVERSGKGLGFWHPFLYAIEEKTLSTTSPAFYDIVSGSNGAYSASVGWDACTGLGSPNASVIASLMR